MYLLGYSDKVSVSPGDEIRFMVNCEDRSASFKAEMCRLICGDNSPDGPGFKATPVQSAVNKSYPARHQAIDPGSYVLIPASSALNSLRSFTVQAKIWPTTPGRGRQTIIGRWSEPDGRGFALEIAEDSAISLLLGDGQRIERVSAGVALLPRVWYFVAATYDANSQEVRIYQDPQSPFWNSSSRESVVAQTTILWSTKREEPLLFAGHTVGAKLGGQTRVEGHFNGKLSAPRLANRALTRDEMQRMHHEQMSSDLNEFVVGAWDFSQHIQEERIEDVSSNALHGTTVNLPSRAVKGPNWTGKFMRWTEAPEEYGAIHFHEDDLYDASWEVDIAFRIPSSWQSGVYAIRLVSDSAENYLPFVVRPGRYSERSPICFILPTATYMAYANNHKNIDSPYYRECESGAVLELRWQDLFLSERREYGLSLYDRHADGSGVCYSSRLRPILEMRPNTRAGNDARWNFVVDTHITNWLEAKGYCYDVITDEDLHHKGAEILEPYKVVVTASHPEYTSTAMWNGLEEYRDSGGRLINLGGNGFHARIAYHPNKPGVIELRRAGNAFSWTAWAAEPGEYYHSFTGERGGRWSVCGRENQLLTGVGSTNAGFDVSGYYRRTSQSLDPRVSFIVEGIREEERIGDFGLMGGGAAGWEIDRYDEDIGQPGHALVIASSEGLSETYLAIFNDPDGPQTGLTSVQHPSVRADMVFFECPNGGAVFSTGSIAWSCSLFYDNYNNNVSRITQNVLDRFLEPAPFIVPSLEDVAKARIHSGS